MLNVLMTIMLIAQSQFASPNGGVIANQAMQNTEGATLLVVALADYANEPSASISDSYGNAWIPLTAYWPTDRSARVRLFYAKNPLVGPRHTFSTSQGSRALYPNIIALSFSGADFEPFDVVNGSTSDYTSPIPTGSITPRSNYELIVTAVAFNAETGTPVVAGAGPFTSYVSPSVERGSFGLAVAYSVQTVAHPENMTWAWPSIYDGAATIAAFKAGEYQTDEALVQVAD